MSGTADLTYIAVMLVIFAALSIYKLVMIYRSRNDPAKYEWYLNQTAIFPERIMRFMQDAGYDEKHPESAPTTHSRMRSIWVL
jgi:hypothetical protein